MFRGGQGLVPGHTAGWGWAGDDDHQLELLPPGHLFRWEFMAGVSILKPNGKVQNF